MGETQKNRARLSLKLFGLFEARLDGKLIEGLHKRKADRLLAYLALHSGHWVEKKLLAATLWKPENVYEPEQNLRQTLFYLRSVLSEDTEYPQSRSGGLRLDIEDMQLDVRQFDDACISDSAEAWLQVSDTEESTLLHNWSDEWIIPFRKKYEEKMRKAQMHQQNKAEGVCTQRRLQGMIDSELRINSAILSLQNDLLEPIGGTVPLNSPFYIERACDSAMYSALARQESIILIKGAKQTGKSSLLARAIQFAQQRGSTVFEANFDLIVLEDIMTLEAFYLHLIALLSEQSNLEFVAERDWKTNLGANGNLERYLRRQLLGTVSTPILWALDGVDKLFKTPFYNTFFSLLRGLHTKRATEPQAEWSRFSIAIATATEAHLYIRDLDQSPFNVGTRIILEDLNQQQSKALTQRFQPPLFTLEEQAQLRELLGGHPYLLLRGLHEIKTRDLDIEEFTKYALRPDGPFHDHLEGIRRQLAADTELKEAMCSVLQGRPCSDTQFFRLRSAGVLIGESGENASPRCGLYGQYLLRSLK